MNNCNRFIQESSHEVGEFPQFFKEDQYDRHIGIPSDLLIPDPTELPDLLYEELSHNNQHPIPPQHNKSTFSPFNNSLANTHGPAKRNQSDNSLIKFREEIKYEPQIFFPQQDSEKSQRSKYYQNNILKTIQDQMDQSIENDVKLPIDYRKTGIYQLRNTQKTNLFNKQFSDLSFPPTIDLKNSFIPDDYNSLNQQKIDQESRVNQKLIAQKKEDFEKNIPVYISRAIIKTFVSNQHGKIVNKIHKKLKFIQVNKCLNYFKFRQNWLFGLSNYFDLLSLSVATTPQEVKFKKAFLIFCRRYLRRYYPIYILKQSKIIKKQTYLKIKNQILYLPDIDKNSLKKKRQRANKRIAKAKQQTGIQTIRPQIKLREQNIEQSRSP